MDRNRVQILNETLFFYCAKIFCAHCNRVRCAPGEKISLDFRSNMIIIIRYRCDAADIILHKYYIEGIFLMARFFLANQTNDAKCDGNKYGEIIL